MDKLRKADVLAKLEQGWSLFHATVYNSACMRGPYGQYELVHLSAFNALALTGIIQPLRAGIGLYHDGCPLDESLAWYETEWARKAGAA